MKRVIAAPVALLLLAVAAAAGVGWYYAGEIEREALVAPARSPGLDLVVAEVGDGTITLVPGESADRDYADWLRPGRYGILSAEGSGTVGEILKTDGDRVTRELLAFNSSIAEGDAVRLSPTLRGDPLSTHGLVFEEVTFESDVGTLSAWHVGGSSDTWAIVVHGRGSGRAEGLGVLPVLAELGLPTLVIQYRNDEGVAGSASGFYDYGLSEWRDLEAAAGYALEHGASDVVLIGYSMGGGIALSFLYRSDLADGVRGVVFDSPVLDFGDLIDFGAERRNLWGGLTWLGKIATTLRSGVSWGELNYVDRADDLGVPILLIHGEPDRTVHVRASDEFAAARPDIVTYLRFDDVGHVRGWNAEREAYEQALAGFLIGTLGIQPEAGTNGNGP